jgi:hypothetical protein
MQTMRLAALGAAGAVLLYSINTKAVVVAIGEGADQIRLGANAPTNQGHQLEPRLASVENRLKAIEHDLERSQRELRSARAALMIARYEMLESDLPVVGSLE